MALASDECLRGSHEDHCREFVSSYEGNPHGRIPHFLFPASVLARLGRASSSSLQYLLHGLQILPHGYDYPRTAAFERAWHLPMSTHLTCNGGGVMGCLTILPSSGPVNAVSLHSLQVSAWKRLHGFPPRWNVQTRKPAVLVSGQQHCYRARGLTCITSDA